MNTSPRLRQAYLALQPMQGVWQLYHPAAIAFNAHGYRVKDIVNLWEDGDERHAPDGIHKGLNVVIARDQVYAAFGRLERVEMDTI